MVLPGPAELLSLWERGVSRHPIDRALLLGAWARPELDPTALPDLPLGALNAALLRMFEACFGPDIDGFADCPRCGTRVEIHLDTGELLRACALGDVRQELALDGFSFRMPASRDLAAVAHEPDTDSAALHLLNLCCLERPDSVSQEALIALMAEVESAFEELDPGSDFELALECPECGQKWDAALVVAELLWDEVAARARVLLSQVHLLARSYGWAESEILSLSPERRGAYLKLIEG